MSEIIINTCLTVTVKKNQGCPLKLEPAPGKKKFGAGIA